MLKVQKASERYEINFEPELFLTLEAKLSVYLVRILQSGCSKGRLALSLDSNAAQYSGNYSISGIHSTTINRTTPFGLS
jgi:hypothetical protein